MPHPGLEHVKREDGGGLPLWNQYPADTLVEMANATQRIIEARNAAASHVAPAGPPTARAGHETQELAAKRAGKTAKGKRLAVLEFVTARGEYGATDHETAAGLSFPLQTVCARRNELMGMGLVRDTGKHRKTRYGCSATVWVAMIAR